MGKLDELGLQYKTDKASNAHNYLDFYEEHLPKSPKRLLEMGTFEGASLKMWRDFYPDTEIVGVDHVQNNHIEGVYEYKMNCRDVYALGKLGKFDVIIDDGSHIQLDQQVFMQFALANMLTDDGVFIMEDIHCCFWEQMQDDSHQNTIEVLKDLESEYDIAYFIGEDETKDYTAILRKKK